MRRRDLGLYLRAAVRRLGMALLCGVMLVGCQSPRQSLQDLAGRHGQQLEALPTQPFPLLLGTPAVAPSGSRLRIYLEGDGRAWATPRQPSVDPSPRNLLVARLAFDDPTTSLYLARPCQFVSASGCTQKVWTKRRFSDEVVDSLDQALSRIKARYGNDQFELIGYSGGAALALLLAARRDDIGQVQTLAGNLAPREWVRQQRLSPLNGSLEPLDYRERLRNLPQRHFAGRDDRIVPPELLRYYRESLGPTSCFESEILPSVTHASGWEQAWRSWRSRSVDCSAE